MGQKPLVDEQQRLLLLIRERQNVRSTLLAWNAIKCALQRPKNIVVPHAKPALKLWPNNLPVAASTISLESAVFGFDECVHICFRCGAEAPGG